MLGNALRNSGVLFHEFLVALLRCFGNGCVKTILNGGQRALYHQAEHALKGGHLFK